MPNRSKQKGDRAERKLVEALRGLGFQAQRVPLSGAAGGEFAGDVVFHGRGLHDIKAEVKSRAGAAGWKTVKGWLGDNDLLLLVEDRQEPLVVLPWEAFTRLVGFLPAPVAPLPEPEV